MKKIICALFLGSLLSFGALGLEVIGTQVGEKCPQGCSAKSNCIEKKCEMCELCIDAGFKPATCGDIDQTHVPSAQKPGTIGNGQGKVKKARGGI